MDHVKNYRKAISDDSTKGTVEGIMQELNEKKDLSYLINKIVASDLFREANYYMRSMKKLPHGGVAYINHPNFVMKYSAGFIGITEERNQSYGDASADWKTPVYFVPLPLYLKIRLKRKL